MGWRGNGRGRPSQRFGVLPVSSGRSKKNWAVPASSQASLVYAPAMVVSN